VRRCKVTGNPCGTDTWMVGGSCPCAECQTYLHEKGDEIPNPERYWAGLNLVFDSAPRLTEPEGDGPEPLL
jgi:hypothetical protein